MSIPDRVDPGRETDEAAADSLRSKEADNGGGGDGRRCIDVAGPAP